MLFSEIIGQDTVKQQLVKMVQSNRLSHAIMLFGQEGVGKKALAHAFAQYIICSNKQEGDACGHCDNCRKAQKLTHPDIHYSYPVIKRKSTDKHVVSSDFIDYWRSIHLETPYFTHQKWTAHIESGTKQTMIHVDEGNEIIKFLNFKPSEAEYRVVMVWLAEKMNTITANTLLKTLEEPGEKTVLILIVENTDFILPTILSRLQTVYVPPIQNEDMIKGLQEQYNCGEDLIRFAAHYAKGRFPLAVEALEQSEEQKRYLDWFIQYMRLSYSNKMLELIDLNEEIVKYDKNDTLSFLKYALRYIRDNFMMNQNGNQHVVLIEEEFNFASKFSRFITPNNIDRIYHIFTDSINHISRNANVKIQLQVLAIELVRAFSSV